ncbi:hypothetical protein V6N12_006351 [Hibiscus sabdariffa]|uniref:Uncharacterized protein n=1 Tax=Hibiscus sabdariffa TaxID=183260 RepID=A0ABR2EYJ9_9ROSI
MSLVILEITTKGWCLLTGLPGRVQPAHASESAMELLLTLVAAAQVHSQANHRSIVKKAHREYIHNIPNIKNGLSKPLPYAPASKRAELEEEREQLTVQEGGYCSGSCGWWPIHLPGRASVPPVADQVEILVAHVGQRRWLHTPLAEAKRLKSALRNVVSVGLSVQQSTNSGREGYHTYKTLPVLTALHSDWYIMKKESHLHQAHCAFPCPDVRLSKSSNGDPPKTRLQNQPRFCKAHPYYFFGRGGHTSLACGCVRQRFRKAILDIWNVVDIFSMRLFDYRTVIRSSESTTCFAISPFSNEKACLEMKPFSNSKVFKDGWLPTSGQIQGASEVTYWEWTWAAATSSNLRV